MDQSAQLLGCDVGVGGEELREVGDHQVQGA